MATDEKLSELTLITLPVLTTDVIYIIRETSPGSGVWGSFGVAVANIPAGTVADGSITLAKLANLATAKIIGRQTAGTGVPEAIDCTAAGFALLAGANAAAQRTTLVLDNVTNDAQTKAAIVPNTAPAAGRILVGNAGGTAYGVVAISGDGAITAAGVLTIANNAISYAKIQNVSATDKILGRATAGAGVVEEIACTAAGRALLAGVDATAQRTTLLAASRTQSITVGFGVDGSGSVIPTGKKIRRVMQQAGTITRWDIVADQPGSIVMNIRKGTPSGGSVTTSSITASAPPTLTSATVAGSSTLTGWTLAFLAGDVLEMEVTGTPSAVTQAVVELLCTVTLA